jgi:hypothetical protein
VDEAVGKLHQWSAANWGLGVALQQDGESEAQDSQPNSRLANEEVEAYGGPHVFPLLKLVRKYLKKLQRALKGSSDSHSGSLLTDQTDVERAVEEGADRRLEEAIAVVRTIALEGKDDLAFKHSRLRFRQLSDDYEVSGLPLQFVH